MSSTPPAQPAPTPSGRPETAGALPWGLGLLVLACVPFVSSVVAAVTMAAVGQGRRSLPGSAGQNARNAANWGLTYLLLTVVLVGGHFTLLFALTRDEPVAGFFPLGIPITLWGVVTLLHLVLCVLGLIRGLDDKVVRAPAIPFLSSRTD